MLAGFRPATPGPTCGDKLLGFKFTAMIELADIGNGTCYTATVIHADESSSKQHVSMGFEQGWGTALDQLVAMIKKKEYQDTSASAVAVE